MAHLGSHSSSAFTVSQAEIAMSASWFASGLVHTALSPMARREPSLPWKPGISHRPMLETVLIPSFSPMIICPARSTSPVVLSIPAKVTSASSTACMTIA